MPPSILVLLAYGVRLRSTFGRLRLSRNATTTLAEIAGLFSVAEGVTLICNVGAGLIVLGVAAIALGAMNA